MARLTWTPQMEAELIHLLQSDPSPVTQAQRNAARILSERWQMDVTFPAVQGKAFYLRESGRFEPPTRNAHAPDVAPPEVKVYRDAWLFPIRRGWLCIGDLHAPYVDWTLLAESIQRARRMGIDALLIVGDLYDAEAFSVYDSMVPQPSFDAEVQAAEYALEMALSTFRYVRIVTGNHDARLLKRLGGALPSQRAGQMFLDLIGGSRDNRALWSVYGYAEIDSPTGRWRLTHQRNYSVIRGRVATRLAAKFKRHIVTYHEHGLAKVPSDCGDYTCIACGCMADPRKMAYIQLVDSTAPTWQQGYVIIDRQGVGYLYGGPPGFAPRLTGGPDG